MPKGVSEKGYKLTQNRKNILNLLIEEGGELKSNEGKSTSILHGLLDKGGSTVALNVTLRELENLGWIERLIEGKRTYNISITDLGREVVGGSPEEPKAQIEEPQAQVEDEWEDPQPAIPGEIDYDVLLGVFLKAALRGMEGPSNSEIDKYKALNNQLMEKVEVLEEDLRLREADIESITAERDQLQKNLNIIVSKAEKKGTRGTDPIRSLLSVSEKKMLDALMRQVPTRQGE